MLSSRNAYKCSLFNVCKIIRPVFPGFYAPFAGPPVRLHNSGFPSFCKFVSFDLQNQSGASPVPLRRTGAGKDGQRGGGLQKRRGAILPAIRDCGSGCAVPIPQSRPERAAPAVARKPRPHRRGGRFTCCVYRNVSIDAPSQPPPLPIKAWSADHGLRPAGAMAAQGHGGGIGASTRLSSPLSASLPPALLQFCYSPFRRPFSHITVA